MAETPITVEDLKNKAGVVLFGDGEAATETLRDYLASLLSPLGCHLELIDDLAAHDDAARTTAMVGAALLRQANGLLDQLHDHLRQAGIGIFVGAEGKTWQPGRVTSMVLRQLPGKVEAQGQEVRHG